MKHQTEITCKIRQEKTAPNFLNEKFIQAFN